MYDKQRFLSMLAAGMCSNARIGKNLPPIAYLAAALGGDAGESGMYSYNGIVLPKLPEWDKENYPYAVISKGATDYWLTAMKEPHVTSSTIMTSNFVMEDGTMYLRSWYDSDAGEWGTLNEHAADDTVENQPTAGFPKWANYDVLAQDGTVRITASEPVEV